MQRGGSAPAQPCVRAVMLCAMPPLRAVSPCPARLRQKMRESMTLRRRAEEITGRRRLRPMKYKSRQEELSEPEDVKRLFGA